MADFTRRDALKSLTLALGAGALARANASHAAENQPHVSPSDPTAMALAYTDDASKVDRKQNGNYQPGQKCGNCLQLQGAEGAIWRPCSLFPGKLVNANGWCRVWVKKS
jgi:hypothetical protein